MNISLRRTSIGDVNVLVVSGDIDLATIPQFADALTVLLRDCQRHTAVVDLDAVQVLDDTGLGVLLGAAARSRADGGDFVVVVTNERLRKRFEDTLFDRVVQVRSTIADI